MGKENICYTINGIQQQRADVSILIYQLEQEDFFMANKPFIVQLPRTTSRFA